MIRALALLFTLAALAVPAAAAADDYDDQGNLIASWAYYDSQIDDDDDGNGIPDQWEDVREGEYADPDYDWVGPTTQDPGWDGDDWIWIPTAGILSDDGSAPGDTGGCWAYDWELGDYLPADC